MAEEFSNFLDQTREAPIREKVDGLSLIIEKMMVLIMSIPESVDVLISNLNDRINSMEGRITSLDGKIANIKFAAPGVATISAENPIVSAGLGTPPPPPGAPPRPGAPPPIPANPVSLRSSIMGELKELFKKRRDWENE